MGNTVAIIERYKMVNVYDYEDGYWLIERDSIRGFVAQNDIGKLGDMIDIKKNYKRKTLTAEFDEITAKKIANKQIWIGMTKRMAELSIGKPEDINKSEGAYGTNEQWVYNNKYLYFENGKLTSWQN